MKSSDAELRGGYVFAVGAFSLWGIAPLYWRLLGSIPAKEIIPYRVVSTLIVFAVLTAMAGDLGEVRRVFHSWKSVRTSLVSGLLIGFNWLVFVYAVETKQVLQTSLAYFINPLMTVLLGLVVLRETLSRAQWVSLALAAAGVVSVALRGGQTPWLALSLAVSFAVYSLVRKTMDLRPLPGSTTEVLLLLPLSLGYLAWKGTGGAVFEAQASTLLLLALSGVVTATPLFLFIRAARILPLSSIGFVQYLAPSMQFALAVFVFGEAIDQARVTSFAFIWLGLAIFSIDLVKRARGT